jgi:hypothetical protein
VIPQLIWQRLRGVTQVQTHSVHHPSGGSVQPTARRMRLRRRWGPCDEEAWNQHRHHAVPPSPKVRKTPSWVIVTFGEPGCRGEDWLADQGSLPPWTFNRQDSSICDARLFARWRSSPPSLLWSLARSPTPCTRLTSPSFQSRFLTHGSRTTQPAEDRDYPDPDSRDHRSAAPPPAWHDY